MNDLLSQSFSESREKNNDVAQIQMTTTTTGPNLDIFFQQVEVIKTELTEFQNLHQKLHESHEQSKTLHNAKSVKELRSRMESDVALALKTAKSIKSRLESLGRDNAACRNLPGSGPGSSSDRTRTSVVNSIIKTFKYSMDRFNDLRQKVSSEYKETVERRYYTVTGEKADEKTIELLISSGESETFMQRAIEEQGRGRVMDTIAEIQERREAVREIERSLLELHQVFLDLSVLVEAQGEQLDDIESQVARANSFVRGGTNQLQTAKKHQKNSRKWTCIGIILLLIIILVIVLPIVLRK